MVSCCILFSEIQWVGLAFEVVDVWAGSVQTMQLILLLPGTLSCDTLARLNVAFIVCFHTSKQLTLSY